MHRLLPQHERHAAARGRMAAHNGHVVIRVAAGGKRYSVFVLDDTDFSYRVLQADGSVEIDGRTATVPRRG